MYCIELYVALIAKFRNSFAFLEQRRCKIPSFPISTLDLCCHFHGRWADKLDSLTATATQDPEGFLGHPVNAFKLMKRLNTEWGDLESLVLSDTTDGMDN